MWADRIDNLISLRDRPSAYSSPARSPVRTSITAAVSLASRISST